jgi:hypothetical protein
MSLITRLPFRSKSKLSKYESALEDALKQKTLYTASVDDTSVLTYVPSIINVPDQDNSATVIVLPLTPSTEGKISEVINNDAAESVSVGGVTCPLGEVTKIRFNGSAWVLLYSTTIA